MSGVKFEPLRSLARNAQRRNMGMQCDPSWVLDVFDERDALRAEVERLRKDKDRLDAIEGNCWDVRYSSCQNGDSGDSSIGLEIVGHFMDAPCERVVGENYNENLRAAIDQAMTADAYPPARPDYGEEDAIGAAMEARQ